MTNGSSQGLFVVVGIIIFGIFIAISYSLFRDTLTPSLASMFDSSILQTEYNLFGTFKYENETVLNKNELNIKEIKIYAKNSQSVVTPINGTEISYNVKSVNKVSDFGIRLPKHGEIVAGNRFLVSFEIEMLKGFATRIGGHTQSFGVVDTIEINNEIFNSDWYSFFEYTLKEGNTYLVKFFIDIIPDSELDPNFYIQVDRGIVGSTQEYNILDIKFQKVLQKGVKI